jgi:spoIIIJ-associated protein
MTTVKDLLGKVTSEVLAKLDVKGEIVVSDEEAGFKAAISSADSALLIGWRGGSLAALEYLVRLLLVRELEKTGELLPEIHLDVEGYKEHQMEELTELAKKTAARVFETKAAEVLRPMNAFERRIIHVALAEEVGIVTESIGVDPNRRIVIKPKA